MNQQNQLLARLNKDNLLERYQKGGRQLQANIGNTGLFMKFANGDWTFGREQEQVTEDMLFAVNFESLINGIAGWLNGSKIHDVSKPFGTPLPHESELPEIKPIKQRDGYSVYFQLSGTFAGEQKLEASWQTGSLGGQKFFNKLVKLLCMDEFARHPNHLYPLVQLTSNSYFNKAYGKEIWEPDFELIGWVNENLEQWEPQARLTENEEDLIG